MNGNYWSRSMAMFNFLAVIMVLLPILLNDVATAQGPCLPDLTSAVADLDNYPLKLPSNRNDPFRVTNASCPDVPKPATPGTKVVELPSTDPGVVASLNLTCVPPEEATGFQGCLFRFSTRGVSTTGHEGNVRYATAILSNTTASKVVTFYSSQLMRYENLFSKDFEFSSFIPVSILSLPLGFGSSSIANQMVTYDLTLESCGTKNCSSTFCQAHCCVVQGQPPAGVLSDVRFSSPTCIHLNFNFRSLFHYPDCTSIRAVLFFVDPFDAAFNVQAFSGGTNFSLWKMERNTFELQSSIRSPWTLVGTHNLTLCVLDNVSAVVRPIIRTVLNKDRHCNCPATPPPIALKTIDSERIGQDFCINEEPETYTNWSDWNCSCQTRHRERHGIGYSCVFHPDAYPLTPPVQIEPCTDMENQSCPVPTFPSPSPPQDSTVLLVKILAPLCAIFVAAALVFLVVLICRGGHTDTVREVSCTQRTISIGEGYGNVMSIILCHANRKEHKDHHQKLAKLLTVMQQWMTDDLRQLRQNQDRTVENLAIFGYVLSKEFIDLLREAGAIQYQHSGCSLDFEPFFRFLLPYIGDPDTQYMHLALVLDGDDDGTTPLCDAEAKIYVPDDGSVQFVRVTYDRSDENDDQAHLEDFKQFLIESKPIQRGITSYLIRNCQTHWSLEAKGCIVSCITAFHAPKEKFSEAHFALDECIDSILGPRLAGFLNEARRMKGLSRQQFELVLVCPTEELIDSMHEVYEAEHASDGDDDGVAVVSRYMQDIVQCCRKKRDLPCVVLGLSLTGTASSQVSPLTEAAFHDYFPQRPWIPIADHLSEDCTEVVMRYLEEVNLEEPDDATTYDTVHHQQANGHAPHRGQANGSACRPTTSRARRSQQGQESLLSSTLPCTTSDHRSEELELNAGDLPIATQDTQAMQDSAV